LEAFSYDRGCNSIHCVLIAIGVALRIRKNTNGAVDAVGEEI
jgi:hypothetical protein